MAADSVVATLRYARADNNEALLTEKAYILNYPTPAGGIPKSNFVIDFFPDIQVQNLRKAKLNFKDNGITMASVPSMPGADFEDETKIEETYLKQVHDCLLKELGADEVYIFDYMVRKRAARFPFQPKTKDGSPQPALSAHIDYTTDEIKGRVFKYFQSRAEEYAKRRYRIVNVWKPLRGPLRDYPMAYCDAKTMDPTTDLLVVDEVFPTVANEVYQVLHNPKHQWYYIPDQLETEVAIFAGFDSRTGQDVAVPHCAFDLGDPTSDPRESIEVRAFVFYKD